MQPPNVEITDLYQAHARESVMLFIRHYAKKHGPKWIAEFKAEYPDFCFIIDLAANYSADEAIEKLCDMYPALHLGRFIYERPIREFHATLREEIDKKR